MQGLESAKMTAGSEGRKEREKEINTVYCEIDKEVFRPSFSIFDLMGQTGQTR